MRDCHCDTNMTNITLLSIGNEYVKRSTLHFGVYTTTGTYSVPGVGTGTTSDNQWGSEVNGLETIRQK